MEDRQIVYTVNDLVEILQFNRTAIIRFIKSGDLKASYIGNQYRIKKESLDEFLLSKERHTKK
ncbi:MAG: helix-turn-helix domain-containing protein [Bacilli bacterium]|nr:helix-turn-helix domain-containing protein [Bacilli bacterium]